MPALPARYKWESAYPQLWPDYGWCPSINPYGITRLYDRGGTNNHGTLGAGFDLSAAWANPTINGLVSNGYSASAQWIPFDRSIALGATLTEVAWVIVDSATTSTWRTIIESVGDDGLQLRNQTVSSVYWHGIVFTTTAPLGSLCQIVITRDSANLVKLYLNGVYTGESATKSVTETVTGLGYNGVFFDWQGSFVDVSIYNRDLSPSEIWTLFTLKPGGVYTPSDRTVFGAGTTFDRRRRVIIGAA